MDTEQQMLEAIEGLSDDANVEHALERLYLLYKIERGVKQERAERRESLEQARAALSGADRARFEAALAYAERVYANRDDNAAYTEGFSTGLIRRASLEVGRRLVERGVLRDATTAGRRKPGYELTPDRLSTGPHRFPRRTFAASPLRAGGS